MTRDETLKLLSDHAEEIRTRFGVKRLAVFGSIARDEASVASDVDVLVEFTGPSTFDGYFGLKFFLEDLIGQDVDLITESGLRPEVRPYVEADAIEIA